MPEKPRLETPVVLMEGHLACNAGKGFSVPAGHPERPEGEDGKRLLARMNGGHHEDLALWGLSQVEIAADARALDIGCGGGANIGRLLERAPQGHVCGLDYSPLSGSSKHFLFTHLYGTHKCIVETGGE